MEIISLKIIGCNILNQRNFSNYLFRLFFSQFNYDKINLSIMQIFVKTFKGKHLVLNADPNSLVGELKQKLQEKEHIPIKIQRLLFSGIQLEDQYTLKHYSILKVIHMLTLQVAPTSIQLFKFPA